MNYLPSELYSLVENLFGFIMLVYEFVFALLYSFRLRAVLAFESSSLLPDTSLNLIGLPPGKFELEAWNAFLEDYLID